MNQIDADAALCAEITELLNEQRALLSVDRRSNDRRSYECSQLVAPYNGESLPGQDEFQPERCNDLSSTGFSFLSVQRPATSKVVVALGRVPFLFFVADIVHVQEVDTERGHEYVVGCGFTSRVVHKRRSLA